MNTQEQAQFALDYAINQRGDEPSPPQVMLFTDKGSGMIITTPCEEHPPDEQANVVHAVAHLHPWKHIVTVFEGWGKAPDIGPLPADISKEELEALAREEEKKYPRGTLQALADSGDPSITSVLISTAYDPHAWDQSVQIIAMEQPDGTWLPDTPYVGMPKGGAPENIRGAWEHAPKPPAELGDMPLTLIVLLLARLKLVGMAAVIGDDEDIPENLRGKVVGFEDDASERE